MVPDTVDAMAKSWRQNVHYIDECSCVGTVDWNVRVEEWLPRLAKVTRLLSTNQTARADPGRSRSTLTDPYLVMSWQSPSAHLPQEFDAQMNQLTPPPREVHLSSSPPIPPQRTTQTSALHRRSPRVDPPQSWSRSERQSETDWDLRVTTY